MPDEHEYLTAELNRQEEVPQTDFHGLSLSTLAAEMKLLKEQIDALESQRESLQARYDRIRKQLLPDALATAGLTSFKLTGGGQVYLKTAVYVNVPAKRQANFIQWLKLTGNSSLITESVHPKTLAAWYNEQTDRDPTFIPEDLGLTVFREPLAVLRK